MGGILTPWKTATKNSQRTAVDCLPLQPPCTVDTGHLSRQVYHFVYGPIYSFLFLKRCWDLLVAFHRFGGMVFLWVFRQFMCATSDMTRKSMEIIHTWSYLYVVYSLLRPYICTHPGRKIMYLHIMPDICISVCIVAASYGTYDPQLMDRWICKDAFHKRRSTDELYAHSQQVSERCLSHL